MESFIQLIELTPVKEECEGTIRIDLACKVRIVFNAIEFDLDIVSLKVQSYWRCVLENSGVLQNDISLVNFHPKSFKGRVELWSMVYLFLI